MKKSKKQKKIIKLKPKPWYMETIISFKFLTLLKFLFGYSLKVRFNSPNGNCSAACNIEKSIVKNPERIYYRL